MFMKNFKNLLSKKIILSGLLFLSAAAGGVYFISQPVTLRLTEIQPGRAELTFTERGIVTAENTVLVFPVVQGEMIRLYAEENQEVQTGDILASIDDTVFRLGIEKSLSSISSMRSLIDNLETEQSRMRQEMQANREALLGELQAVNARAANADELLANQNQAVYEQMRIQNLLIYHIMTDVERIREDYIRTGILYREGAVPLRYYEAAEAGLLYAETLLESRRRELYVMASGFGPGLEEYFEGMQLAINAQISNLDFQIAQDFTVPMAQHFQALISAEEANIAQMEWGIANSRVISPACGIITALYARGTNFLSPSVPAAEITVHGGLEIETYISTRDVNNIHTGDRVRLTLLQRGDDIIFYGTVTETGDRAVVRHTHLGVEERGINVVIVPDEVSVPLGVGFEIDVTFFVYSEENRLTVPITALFYKDGQYRVWVIRGSNTGEVTSAVVKPGRELRTETVITSGLYKGDFVVNDAGNQTLREGMRVRAK